MKSITLASDAYFWTNMCIFLKGKIHEKSGKFFLPIINFFFLDQVDGAQFYGVYTEA